MKRNRIVHRLFVATSLLLGLFVTGIGAKANSVQPNQVNENNNYNNGINYTNQNQVQNYNAQLVSNYQQNNDYRPVNNHVSNVDPSSSHSVQPHFNQADNFNQTKNAYSNRYVNNYSRYPNQRKINQQTVRLHNRIIKSGIHRIHSQNRKSRPVQRLKVYHGQARARLLHSHLYYHYMRLAHLRGNRIHHYKVYPVDRVKKSHPHAHHRVNHMNQPRSMNRSVKHRGMFYQRWFRDGLSRRNYRARKWVSWHESNHRWHVLSYGGVCVGYFQLNPHYLGYRHGHVDLRKRHQVNVADHYVAYRYGNWVNAKAFWEVHHWY